MFSVLLLAFLSSASAQYISQYPSARGYGVDGYGANSYGLNNYGLSGYGVNNYGVSSYGVNPVVPQYPVPTIGQSYGFANQKVVPNTYGSHSLNAPTIQYDRDYNIEGIGEKYGYQSGPASFQYSFVRGGDVQPHGIDASAFSRYASPAIASYGVPHHTRVAADLPAVGVPQYAGVYGTQKLVQPIDAFNGRLRSTQVVPKFDTYSAKDLISH